MADRTPRSPVPLSPVSDPLSFSRARVEAGTLVARNVGQEFQLYDSRSTSQQKDFHVMDSDTLDRDVEQRCYPVGSASSSSPVQVLGASGFDGRRLNSGILGDVPRPVRSMELPSTSQYIWTPDDFVRNTPERQSVIMEEAQLLLGLQEERRFSESGYNRRQEPNYRMSGLDFQDTNLLQSVRLDRDDDVQFRITRARPTLEYRLVSDGGRHDDNGSLQQDPGDVSTGGLLPYNQEVRADRLPMELSGTLTDDTGKKEMYGSSRTLSRAGSTISVRSGESKTNRLSPFTDISAVSSLAASMQSAINGAIDRIDGQIADVSHCRERLSQKRAQQRSGPDGTKPREVNDRGRLATQCHVTGLDDQPSTTQIAAQPNMPGTARYGPILQQGVLYSQGQSSLQLPMGVQAEVLQSSCLDTRGHGLAQLSSAVKPVVSSDHHLISPPARTVTGSPVDRNTSWKQAGSVSSNSRHSGKMSNNDDCVSVVTSDRESEPMVSSQLQQLPQVQDIMQQTLRHDDDGELRQRVMQRRQQREREQKLLQLQNDQQVLQQQRAQLQRQQQLVQQQERQQQLLQQQREQLQQQTLLAQQQQDQLQILQQQKQNELQRYKLLQQRQRQAKMQQELQDQEMLRQQQQELQRHAMVQKQRELHRFEMLRQQQETQHQQRLQQQQQELQRLRVLRQQQEMQNQEMLQKEKEALQQQEQQLQLQQQQFQRERVQMKLGDGSQHSVSSENGHHDVDSVSHQDRRTTQPSHSGNVDPHILPRVSRHACPSPTMDQEMIGITKSDVCLCHGTHQHEIFRRDTTPEFQEGDRINIPVQRPQPRPLGPIAFDVPIAGMEPEYHGPPRSRRQDNAQLQATTHSLGSNQPAVGSDNIVPVSVTVSGIAGGPRRHHHGSSVARSGDNGNESGQKNAVKPAISGDSNEQVIVVKPRAGDVGSSHHGRQKESNSKSSHGGGEQQQKDTSSTKTSDKQVRGTKNKSSCRDQSPSSPDNSDSDSGDDDKKKKRSDVNQGGGRKSSKQSSADDDKKQKEAGDSGKPQSGKDGKKSNSGDPDDSGDGSSGDDEPDPAKKDKPHRQSTDKLPDQKLPYVKEIKPNKYGGKGCVETFIRQFEVVSKHNRWSKSEMAAQLMCSLIDDAGRLIWNSGNTDDVTYDDLVEKLRRLYGSLDQQVKFEAELFARRRRTDEPLAELYQDIRCLMLKAYPNDVTTDMGRRVAVEQFLKSLQDPAMSTRIRDREPRNLEDAFKLALQYESRNNAEEKIEKNEKLAPPAEHSTSADGPLPRDGPRGRNRYPRDEGLVRRVTELENKVTATNSPAQTQQNAEVEEMRHRMNEMSKELGRLQALQQPRAWSSPRFQQPASMTQLPAPQAQQFQFTNPVQRGRSDIVCHGCGLVGHIVRFCPNPRRPVNTSQQQPVAQRQFVAQQQQQQQQQPQPPVVHLPTTAQNVQVDGKIVGQASGATVVGDDDVSERKTYLQLFINGVLRRVLLDTGSDVTLFPSFTVFGTPVEKCSQRLLAANGTTINIHGRVTVNAYMGEHKFQINGLVTNHVAEVMLGIDFLKEHDAIWNFRTGKIQLDNFIHELQDRGPSRWCRRVILQQDCVVPPRSEVDVPTCVVYNDLSQRYPEGMTQQWTTQAHAARSGLQVSRTLMPDADEDVPVRVLNIRQQPITLQTGTVISDLDLVDICDTADEGNVAIDEVSETQEDPVLVEMVNRVDDSVSASDRQRLLELLTEYSSTFSRGETDLGWTDIVTHSIDTGDSKPVRQSLRRHPPVHQEAIKQQISSMLEQGVIEPARSPWASNIVMVKKKDGSLRTCIDYRQLNSLTRKDAYPLPRTDVCLDSMAGSIWFSTFDMRAGYHQLAMDPMSADATAFICSEGQFRFRTMPFGLCNAPSSFMRLMDIVMSGLNYEVCLTYVDDVIVYSTSLDLQFTRLRLVLERLKQAGLKLKPSKCSLLCKSVTFLGHVLSAGKIAVDPGKVNQVLEWPVPINLKEVRGFVGLCSYYRRFIKDFAQIAAPLNAMSEKNCNFEWSETCQQSMDTLKKLLTTAPLLVMPNSTDPFILDTDASQCTIGGVLSQIQDGVEHPVAYASKKLSRAEMNYCVTRKELRAVVFFLKYFRHYLLGRKFTSQNRSCCIAMASTNTRTYWTASQMDWVHGRV